jgi:hypothetical protein
MPSRSHAITPPLPGLHDAPEPGLLARALARVRRLGLDLALADGADPAGSAQLAARASRLTHPVTRAGIARGLERLAFSEVIASRCWHVAPSHPATRENREELLALASLLRSDRRVYVRGIAQLHLVVIDGTGPAYRDRRGEALARELALARAALAG